jgi:hypothetical protein
MIYIKRLDTCFLRIPKTGSQALLLFLEQNVVDRSSDIVSRPARQEYINKYKDLKHNKDPLNCEINFPTAHITAQFTIDNNICTPNTRFIGVIRDPYEKQISNYIYRIRQKKFDVKQEDLIKDFRERIKTGLLADELKKHHLIPQSDFFKYDGNYLTNIDPWLYEDFHNKLYTFCSSNNISVVSQLREVNMSPGNKKKLIDILYTPELKQLVYSVYKEDFELRKKYANRSVATYSI